MKRVYPKLLKKLTIQKIKKIRDLYRAGYSIERLSKMFKVSNTTINWHVAELKDSEHIEVI